MAEHRIADLPKRAEVAVVGAGLSGLVAARELARSGVDDVVVVEARDRVGGRLCVWERPDGRALMKGGEFTGLPQAQLHALAAELGVQVEPLPAFADPGRMGSFVRVHAGRRHVEPIPLADDPRAGEVYGAARAAIEALIASIPVADPWNAEDALALDRRSVGDWLDEHAADPAARAVLVTEFLSMGDPYEVSLLYAVWFMACLGGLEGLGQINSGRFVGGSAQIPQLLADELAPRIALSAPVLRIEQDESGVCVHTARGAVRARVVVLAMEPGQCGRIQFDPALPPARERLQTRWLAAHGAKVFAVYERAFWRDEGLAGIAMGPAPLRVVLDVSPSDASEGILCGVYFATSPNVVASGAALEDDVAARTLVADGLEAYFGPQARSFTELHVCSWAGDPWSRGCGSGLPLGTLSTVGRALREPVGRIVWAGAETGTMDFMEGAVTAGQRAAREAADLTRTAPARA